MVGVVLRGVFANASRLTILGLVLDDFGWVFGCGVFGLWFLCVCVVLSFVGLWDVFGCLCSLLAAGFCGLFLWMLVLHLLLVCYLC